MDVENRRPSLPGSWSHDAFHEASATTTAGDPPPVPMGITLPWAFDAERGFELWRPPSDAAFAKWRALDAVRAFDRDLLRRPTVRTGSDLRAPIYRRVLDVLWERDAAATQHEKASVDEAVAQLLADGLRARVGQRLVGDDLRVFVHLAARAGGSPDGVRVCEGCEVVFERARAKRCAECRHTAGRFKLRAHHTDARWVRNARGKPSLTYFFRCAECGRETHASDARFIHCPEHAENAASIRKCREAKRTA